MANCTVNSYVSLDKPSKWPNANARLLSSGGGLPVAPLDRLALFSADDFERFVLEWADGYLKVHVRGVYEVQQRGGAGDKGRDIVVWLDPPTGQNRRWELYQCKRYATAIGVGKGISEIGKVLYYAFNGDYSLPERYYFVARKGVTTDFQDYIDNPIKLKEYLVANWDKYCSNSITSKKVIPLKGDFLEFIQGTDFSFIRVKQLHEMVAEHEKTTYHLIVFGKPLIERPPSVVPPSNVAESEQVYIAKLFDVIAEMQGIDIASVDDFQEFEKARTLFSRARITFYSAEGLKELARDQMADVGYFGGLLKEFNDGLYYYYTDQYETGLRRLMATVKAAQMQQLSDHPLCPHLTPTDREGVCHHLANTGEITWCDHD